MSYTFTNQVSATLEYNTSYALNNSWVKVLNNAGPAGSSKPLYAQASFITNLDDINISLGDATVSIGSIEINDPVDHSLRANVVATAPGQGGVVTYVANVLDVNAIIEERPGSKYGFSNHSINVNRGWTIPSSMVPVFSIQMKSGYTTSDIAEVEEYVIGGINVSQATLVYEWYEGNVSISGPTLPTWTNLGTKLQYRIYTDWHSSQAGHTFTANGATLRHTGLIIGRNTDNDEAPVELYGGASPNMLTLCLKRVDSSSDVDVWFAVNVKEL
jgi:hypothetical protein